MNKTIKSILVLVGLVFLGGVVSAQTSNIQAPSTSTATTPVPVNIKPLPADTGTAAIPTLTTVAPTSISPANTTAARKCGVNTFAVNNECGLGAFKNAYIQCYDGYEENLGGESSCKSSEAWQKYGKEICANRCSTGYMPKPLPMPTPAPVPQPLPAPKPVSLAKPITICVISDNLMKEYNALILALQKTEQDRR